MSKHHQSHEHIFLCYERLKTAVVKMSLYFVCFGFGFFTDGYLDGVVLAFSNCHSYSSLLNAIIKISLTGHINKTVRCMTMKRTSVAHLLKQPFK